MEIFIEPIGKLINEFSKLPGVGKKTAQRYAYKIIDMPESEARAFADMGLEDGQFAVRLRGKQSDDFQKSVNEIKATFEGVKIDIK